MIRSTNASCELINIKPDSLERKDSDSPKKDKSDKSKGDNITDCTQENPW